MLVWIKNNLRYFMYSVLLILLATGGGYIFRFFHVQEINTVLLYIVAVLLIARYTNKFAWGIFSAFLATAAFNFFFTQPVFTLSVYDANYFITFACMMVAAVFTGVLTLEAGRNADRAMEREADVKALYHLASQLSSADTVAKIEKTAVDNIGNLFQCRVESSFGPETDIREDMEQFVVNGQEGRLGAIGILREAYESMQEERRTLLHTMIENIGIALDRVHTSEERYKNQELMEKEKYRANLLRSISHDLRTPLMGIMGTAEMIMDMSAEKDPRRKLAGDIHQDADWLHSLVENILGLTRLQNSARLSNRNAEALEEIIASAVARVEKNNPWYDILVELPENYIEVEADARLLSQVFTNLLDNAIRHTPAGAEIKLVVREKEDNMVEIRVMDRGEGIVEQDLPHIFEMFYTSAQRAADVKHGIGLGLAVSSMVVEAHGGKIEAANRQDGNGAVFTVTLPEAGGERKVNGENV